MKKPGEKKCGNHSRVSTGGSANCYDSILQSLLFTVPSRTPCGSVADADMGTSLPPDLPPNLPPETESAPVAFVRADESGVVRQCNRAAVKLGVTPGARLSDILAESGKTTTELTTGGRRKPVRVTAAEDGGIWIEDLSETNALSREVQKLRRPLSRELRQVSQQATNALGYAELLTVILDEQLGIEPDKQQTLQLYQSEIVKALQAIRETLAASSQTGMSANQGAGHGDSQTANQTGNQKANQKLLRKDGEILIADGHRDLADLIGELLKTRGYKSVSFTKPGAALEYARLNGASIQVALVDETLVDETMKSGDGSLAKALAALGATFQPAFHVIPLTAADQGHAGDTGALKKPVDFDELFKAVESPGRYL